VGMSVRREAERERRKKALLIFKGSTQMVSA